MKITTTAILSKINNDFTSTYKPQSKFKNSGVLWDECINAVQDVRLMNNIIFSNDIMKIPPVKTFLMANNIITGPLTDEEKKAIGAFWGFVFKFVFGYSSQKENNPVNVKTVKSATYFYDVEDIVEVIV